MNIASNPDCVSNDLDVLQRQLSKIRQWENSEASFTKANVDDLEIIFTAIASHLTSKLRTAEDGEKCTMLLI